MLLSQQNDLVDPNIFSSEQEMNLGGNSGTPSVIPGNLKSPGGEYSTEAGATDRLNDFYARLNRENEDYLRIVKDLEQRQHRLPSDLFPQVMGKNFSERKTENKPFVKC